MSPKTRDERLKDFLARNPSVNRPPLSIHERIRRHPYVSRYPEFCSVLLRRFPGRHFVFFERDALPFRWVMEVLLPAVDHSRLHQLYLNIKMMSEKLRRLIPDEESAPIDKMYERRRRVLRKYLRETSQDADLASRFVRQELAGVPTGSVLVDTGYWGTMPVFAQAALPAKRFELALLFGPPNAPAYQADPNGPNGAAMLAEDYFDFPYEADGLVEVEGRLKPDIAWSGDDRLLPRFEEQRAALIELAREWRDAPRNSRVQE